MARGSDRIEREFIETAKDKTGRDLSEWMAILKAAPGEHKSQALLKWLKATYDLNHMQAAMLSGIYLNDGKPVYDYPVLFSRIYDGKDSLRPVVAALEEKIKALLGDIEFIPTQNYISIEGRKIFACATLTRSNIRVGLDLGSHPFGDTVQKARGLGAMPNLSHMVEIETVDQVNDDLLHWVEISFQRNHPIK
jgi:predicted transport protein